MKEQVKQIAAQTKERNIPFVLNESALDGLVTRIAGDTYAERIVWKQILANTTGMDRYRISDREDGKIVIEATGGVAAATAFRWYLENRCDSYVGPLTRRLNFPTIPPKVGTVQEGESICLYRYFLNYCTYGYTLAFWQWDEWENLLDWMMLAGYNLVLNPIGDEAVWLKALQKLGYAEQDARQFIASPTVYPWQGMMNITTWAGAAPDHWYENRVDLSRRVIERLQSFGASAMAPGWSGMVPMDFKKYFPQSAPYDQGLWEGHPRPAILLPEDPCFEMMAECYYETQKEVLGDQFRYFSTDPFHEGGDSSAVKLAEYSRKCYKFMEQAAPGAVWFLQGWQDNPLREMLRALSPANVLIGNLRATYKFDGGDNFADYPWLYCCVNNFGGQRSLRGNMNKMLKEAIEVVSDDNFTSVGIGMIPEGIEICEILYDIFADYAIQNVIYDTDKWLEQRIRIRYGACGENTLKAWKIMRDEIMTRDTESSPLESALCTRPSLTVDRVSNSADNEFTYDPQRLREVFVLLMSEYEEMPKSETYQLDLVDIARQVVADSAWTPLRGIQSTYIDRDEHEFEKHAESLMQHYALQEKLLCCDRHTMVGPWLERARKAGKTPAEKAYFEFLARTIITLWGNRDGAVSLRDYAAREWSGMLEDFYHLRWISFINQLRISFVTGKIQAEYEPYDAECFYTTLSKEYPTEPTGDLNEALKNILERI